MATDKDNFKIEINIAGETLLLSVPYSKQESVRNCEHEIQVLYSDWKFRFPRKSPSELLAMIAYQYASFYLELKARMDKLTKSMEATSSRLSFLLDSDNIVPDSDAPDHEI